MFKNGRERVSWDQFAMNLAIAATTRSEDPYVQVGAVCLRDDNSVAGVGFNGPPAGIDIDWSDREKRSDKVVHAEMNCLNYVRAGEGKLIATTVLPCVDCMKHIAAKRIKRVVYMDQHKYASSLDLAKEFGIELIKLGL